MQGGDFDREAIRYERARPVYPEALFSRLMSTCGLKAGMRALEIGPGTGQATEPLARRGLQICAVELGQHLATIARNRLKSSANVDVLTADFERVELPAESFDLVYAATALHWIAPPLRFAKSHNLLKPGGHLAIIHTEQISDERGNHFVHATQPAYRRFSNQTEMPDYVPPALAELAPMAVDSALFRNISFDVFPMQFEYTTAAYVDLLRTYSPTIAMAPDRREGFLDAIANLIDREFGGRVVRHVAMTLLVARRS